MPTYNYTHGSTANLDRVRLLVGDHRGTNGVSTNWAFSDDEIADIVTLSGSNLHVAARVCLQIRANREAINAGVAGTTDTTDRTNALLHAISALERMDVPVISSQLPDYERTGTTETAIDDRLEALENTQ